MPELLNYMCLIASPCVFFYLCPIWEVQQKLAYQNALSVFHVHTWLSQLDELFFRVASWELFRGETRSAHGLSVDDLLLETYLNTFLFSLSLFFSNNTRNTGYREIIEMNSWARIKVMY